MADMTPTGFYLCAVAYLAVAALVVLHRQRLMDEWRLAAASVVTAIWALLLPLDDPNSPVSLLAEAARSAAWVAVLASTGGMSLWRTVTAAASVLSGVLLAVALAMQGLSLPVADHSLPAVLVIRSNLMLALVGLIAIEQVYRNAPAILQPALRPFLLAIGVPLAYDLFLFAQSELLGEMSLGAASLRGFVYAGASIGLVAFLRRRAPIKLDFAVSRSVAFYTTTMMSIGLYLSAMAVGGYYVRLLGGDWGELIQLVFLAGAGLVLLRLMVSQELRRRIRVGIAKNFYRHKYDYRAAWLRFIETISSSTDRPYETALRAVAQTIESPRGFLFKREQGGTRYECVAGWSGEGTAPGSKPDIAADSELIRFLAERQWVIDLREMRLRPAHYSGVKLPEWLVNDGAARMVSPVLLGGELHGVLVLDEPPAPFDISFEDRDLLIILGRQIAVHLAQFEASQRLSENQQFETFARVGVFLVHDLKNSAAQLGLVVDNARRHRHNPEFIDDAVRTAENVVSRIGRLIEHLRPTRGSPAPAPVRVDELLRSAVERCADRQPLPVLVEATADQVLVERDVLLSAVEHLIRNAQDATPSSGRVQLKTFRHDAYVEICVEDSGAGMDETFLRDRLFKPFDSTKGAAGMGIGAHQVREGIRSMGGYVEVKSEPGAGTRFSVFLPIPPTMRDRVA